MARATVRTIAEDELRGYANTTATAMLGNPISDEGFGRLRTLVDITRSHAAVDTSGALCGTAQAFGSQLTVPGGAAVPAGNVTAVGVLPTHRRQGHLTRMMKAQLRDIASRGEQVAILIAAEYPIYGRFGYGPATEAMTWELDASAVFRDAPTGSAALLTPDELLPLAKEIYERARPLRPGFFTPDDTHLAVVVGALPSIWGDGKPSKRTGVVWRDRKGTPQGFAAYHVADGTWTRNRPDGTLQVDLLIATSAEAERELWRFLASVDWISRVKAGPRPLDEALPYFLVDGRQASSLDRSDNVWARVIDLRGALAARTYSCEGRLVLDVVDSVGIAKGRVVLDGGPEGATCERSKQSPDLTVSSEALGAAYLGGTSFERLHAAGWVTEERAGAVALAAAMFTSFPGPWTPLGF